MKVSTSSLTACSKLPFVSDETTAPDKPLLRKSLSSQDLAVVAERFNELKRAASLSQSIQKNKGQDSFVNDIEKYLRRRWIYERSVAHDYCSDTVYGELRRNQLNQIPGGEIAAAQYGIDFASEYHSNIDFIYKLHTENDHDAYYQRDQPSEKHYHQCQKLYEGSGGTPEDTVIFLNSKGSALRLLNYVPELFLSGTPEQHLESMSKTLYPGIIALRFKPQKKFEECVTPLVHLLGCRPSAYQVARSAVSLIIKPVVTLSTVSMNALDILSSDNPSSGTSQLRKIPKSHAGQALANAAADMLDDFVCAFKDTVLKEQLQNRSMARRAGKNPEPIKVNKNSANNFQHSEFKETRHNSAIYANGLASLGATAQALPTLTHDSLIFADCYHALVEELHVLLSAAKPYSIQDFKKATQALMEQRIDENCIKTSEVFLVSSGMQAISIGLEIAQQLSNKSSLGFATHEGKQKTPIYYELDNILRMNNRPIGDGSTLYATLNHNNPKRNGEQWNVTKVIECTKKTIQRKKITAPPLTLILDSTVEKKDDLKLLTRELSTYLQQGKLRILLCKSYQKFANLCNSKVMAGSISLISVKSEATDAAITRLQNIEKELNWMGNDESQLMVHFLRAGKHEFNLLEKANKNARFVRDQLFSGDDGDMQFDGYEDKLPFALITSPAPKNHQFSSDTSVTAAPYKLSRTDWLCRGAFRERNSFGFAETTQAVDIIPDEGDEHPSVRLSFGQETEEELLERFYMPSQLMANTESRWNSEEAYNLFNSLINNSTIISSNPSKYSLSITQKIALISSATQLHSHNKKPLFPIYDKRLHSQKTSRKKDFTMNKLASIVCQLGYMVKHVFDQENMKLGANDRVWVDKFLPAFLNSGMSGVSFQAKQKILHFQQFLSLSDLKSGNAIVIGRGVEMLLFLSSQMGSSSQLRVTTLSQFPDELFNRQPLQIQHRFIDGMFRPLDINTRMEFIDNRINAGDLNIADACIHAMENDLASRKQSNLTMLSPESLTHSDPDWKKAPPLISALEHQLLMERLYRSKFDFSVKKARNKNEKSE